MSMANIPNHVEPRTNVKPDPTEEPPRQHTYDPLSLYGPNGAAPEAHKPGQISHPNMQSDDGDWRHGLCECGDFGTCCLGCWCPCMLYGKTQYRLNQKSARKDPTNLLSYKACNDSCIVMGVACGFECESIATPAVAATMISGTNTPQGSWLSYNVAEFETSTISMGLWAKTASWPSVVYRAS